MTISQTADITMFRNILEFLDQKSPVVATSATLKEDYDDFVAQMSQLDTKMTEINGYQNSAAATKAQLKVAIAEKTVLMFGFLRRFAYKSNDENLQKSTEVTATSIKQMSDNDFFEFCKQTDTILRQNEAVLTAHAVTPDEQTALLAQLNSFKSLKPLVKLNQSKRVITNEDIAECIKNINGLLKNLMDVSVKTVYASNPEFVRHYELNRIRREPIKSITQVTLIISNMAGDGFLKGAKVVIPTLSLVGVTDEKGQLTIKTGNLKTLECSVSMDGMQSQDITITDIVRGSTTNYAVKMKVGETIMVLH
jgi:hypothetical protein